ncbi:MAG: hypothetical protein ACKVQU_30535 [Burkholderiales bacterium]
MATDQSCPIGTDRIVDALRRPNAYRERTLSVDAIETHMSWVFKTDQHAFKLKKPLRTPYFDHRSLDARHRNSVAEIRLNRRFAAGVYLDTIPVTYDPREGIKVDGAGEVIDWLVKMRRLDESRMLDQGIARGTWSTHDLRAVATLLSRYYGSTDPIRVEPAAYVDRLRTEIEDISHALDTHQHGVSLLSVHTTCRRLLGSLHRNRAALERRAGERRIVDGHGDLRPEHICLEADPVIIDCLEFDDALRILDPIDDLGFLALECERLGAPEAGNLVLATYRTISNDDFPETLLDFYQAFRAALRAKLAAAHLHEDRFKDSMKWRHRTIGYLDLACRRLE